MNWYDIPAEDKLDAILHAMNKLGKTFSKDDAARIVGGEKRLEKLICSGRIRAEKRTNAQNGKWFCNAADVLRNCRVKFNPRPVKTIHLNRMKGKQDNVYKANKDDVVESL